MLREITIIVLSMHLGACSTKPFIVESDTDPESSKEYTVFVVSHGWHTGIVVPTADLLAVIPELKARFSDSQYLEIGWGDKGFYQAEEITTGFTLRAIFLPTESVVHVVAIPKSPYESFPYSKIQFLCLGDRNSSSLIRFIAGSFQSSSKSKIIELKHGIYGDSQFYKGVGKFYIFNTCNKWTAKGIKSAGFDINPTFKLTTDSIMNYLYRETKALTNACSRTRWSHAADARR